MNADDNVPAPAGAAAVPPDLPATSAPPSSVPAAARRRRRRGVRIGLVLLTLLTLVVAALLSTAWWALRSERGTAWLLSVLPGVQVVAPKGSLLGGDFEARQLTVELPGAGGRITVADLGWHGLHLQRGTGPLWLHVTVDSMYARRIDVATASKPASSTPPPRPPADLRLPIEFELRSLKVGELHATPLGDLPLRNIDAGLHLGANAGAEHRIDRLGLDWDRLRLDTHARVASAAPMQVDASITLAQVATGTAPAWGAQATLSGPLARPVLQATLRASPGPERPAQTLDAHATLTPFAPWPLAEMAASAAALDISAFNRAAPATALSLEMRVASTSADQPARISLDLRNALAGRWDEARLPLHHLTLDIAARPDRPSELAVRTLTAELGTPQSSAGRITATGQASPERWNLDATVAALQPGRLDARAPAMALDGSVRLSGDGSAAAAPGRSAASGVGSDVGSGAGRGAPTIDVKAALAGRLAGPGKPQAVNLQFDAGVSAQQLDLRALNASAGAAKAAASGVASRAADTAPWTVKAQATLAEFDPTVWWPGADDSAWRRTLNRINATLKLDTTLAPDMAARPPLDALAAWRGQLEVGITQSWLAGVPLSGNVELRGAVDAPVIASAVLDADTNRVRIDGRLAAGGSGQDAWDVVVEGNALQRLAPLFRILQPAGADAALAGTLNAKAHVAGRWPTLTTQGELNAKGLRVGTLGLQLAEARWTAGTSATDPVDVQASLAQATIAQKGAPGPSLEAAQLRLTGSARAHTLEVRAESKVRPPPWVELAMTAGAGASAGSAPVDVPAGVPARSASAAARTSTSASASASAPASTLASISARAAPAAAAPGSPPAPALVSLPGSASTSATGVASASASASALSLTVRAQGGLVDLPEAKLAGWRGTLQQLELRSRTADARPLVRARDLTLEGFWAGGPARGAAQPGRIDLMGGAVRWNRLAWQAPEAGGAPARIEIDAQLEPFGVVPLLAAAQPGFGWGGDLVIAGHVRVRSAPRMHADVVVERSSGDLTLSNDLERRALGLTDLRIGVSADDGVWNFTTALGGKSLGVTSGAVVVRTSPQALWPTPDAPVQGVLELRIADLAGLGSWAPPGWRVGGALHASASFGGRFGAPEYTGSVEGAGLSVRNFLEGVNVRDGDLAVSLEGTRATLERFSAKAGDGTLKIAGTANFGEAPQAELKVNADKFQLLGRVDRRVVTSGAATLRLDSRSIGLDGRFGVDEGLIDFSRSDAPALPEDVQVSRAPGVPSPAAAASAAASPARTSGVVAAAVPTSSVPPRTVALNLRVDLGDKLALRGRGLDARLGGELHITSPDSKMAVDGSVRVVDGTYQAYGQKLTIDRGVISFNGPIDRPRLDIEATRPKLDIRVGVAITGSVVNPRVRLFSEPELSEVDKLSWLVMGRASDNLGRTESALMQRAALALVSGEGPGLSDRVTKALGLDELSLGQSEGDVKQTVLSLGKQLSDRWYLGYAQGLNATAGSFQLIYKAAQRFTLRAQSGEDNSLDLIWTWRWQ